MTGWEHHRRRMEVWRARLVRRVQLLRRRWRPQQVWEGKWATEGYHPSWLLNQLPWEIEEAVDSEWLPRGATVLDIGCGTGELASRLAARGYRVMGIDFATPAIEQARAKHLGLGVAREGGLEFGVVDIRADVSWLGTYGALIDRGCFHNLHGRHHRAYADNVGSLVERDGRFLLTCQVRDMEPEARLAQVESVLTATFTIERVEDTLIGTGAKDDGIAGLSLWMVRR